MHLFDPLCYVKIFETANIHTQTHGFTFVSLTLGRPRDFFSVQTDVLVESYSSPSSTL